MSRRPVLSSAAVAVVAASLALNGAPPVGAADAPSEASADRAVAYLATQQQSSGGFGGDTSPNDMFVGTETVDAVLAIGEAAQSTLTYDAAAARRAVTSVTKSGRSALDFLDDLAESEQSAGKYAEITIAAVAVGLDPRSFDPQGDGVVDLIARIDATRTPGFYGDLLVLKALAYVGRPIPAATRDGLLASQRSDGGWNFAGDQDEMNPSDADITGAVLELLVAADVDVDAASVTRAVAFLASQQNADGGFHPAYDTSSNPTSTRNAVVGLTAAGHDVVDGCWQPAKRPFVSPDAYLRAAQESSGRVGPAADFLPTQNTSAAVQSLLRNIQPVRRAGRAACTTSGYRLIGADGGVFTHGDAGFFGSTGGMTLNRPVVAAASTPSGKGYWLFASDGGVFAFGDAGFFGSTGGITLNRPIVAAAVTPSGGGYWLFASDGGAFAFGDAAFLGSMGDVVLNKPILGGAPSMTGDGYWLFASDGGVFSFGDAGFFGSAGGSPLNQPIVGGAASRKGRGYTLFASDGGVFAFGDAPFLGSEGERPLNQPIVTGFRGAGDGYYLVAADGGVFAEGAPFLGSEGAAPLNSPIVTATR
jgi:hypothetical protein